MKTCHFPRPGADLFSSASDASIRLRNARGVVVHDGKPRLGKSDPPMKILKHSLMIGVALSALFQVFYGSILFVHPSFISAPFEFGDVASNIPLLVVTRLYGKLFITVG